MTLHTSRKVSPVNFPSSHGILWFTAPTRNTQLLQYPKVGASKEKIEGTSRLVLWWSMQLLTFGFTNKRSQNQNSCFKSDLTSESMLDKKLGVYNDLESPKISTILFRWINLQDPQIIVFVKERSGKLIQQTTKHDIYSLGESNKKTKPFVAINNFLFQKKRNGKGNMLSTV